jgi:hypothetical protein
MNRSLPADRLSPGQLAALVNAAAPDTITARQIGYQLDTTKFPLGRGRRIRLLFYVAWLRRLLMDGKKLKHHDTRSQADIKRELSAQARDIGAIPAVKNPERRAACRLDLAKFLTTYLPGTFKLPFSADHLHVIGKIQTAALTGGLFAEAVFRGFGKTSILQGAAIWAALYGHRRFVAIIAADHTAGTDIIDAIKAELEDNDLLAQDFPEVCLPARALEGIAHRCPGQTSGGKPTKIQWRANALVLPNIAGAESAGVVLKSYGLTGRLRGMNHKHPDGSAVRPDFVLLDDPQTDASAKSPSQCKTREDLITGAVLGLGGHTQKLFGVIACTIIRRGDMADRILDHEAHPEWQGTVLPMVRKWADRHDDLWLKEYADLRRRDIADAEGGRDQAVLQATAFYAANRAAMDAGCEISWQYCKEPEELSAIQHAYDLLVDRGEKKFMAEYQNAPLDEFEGIEPALEPRDVLVKLNRLPRYAAEHGASVIVSFVDPGKQSHVHWLTCWFGDGFTGGELDRGVLPVTRGRFGVEAALTATLTRAVEAICGRTYPVIGGGDLRVGLCAVDSGWMARKVIYPFCRQSPYAALLAPSKGQGGEWELRAPRLCSRRDQGDGWHHALTQQRDARLLMYDTDAWKSFTSERLRTPMGGRGCFSLWGDRAEEHRVFAEHVTAERPAPKTKKNGDVFAKWSVLPGRENHFWDCLVGCHVAAARLGMTLDAAGGQVSSVGLGAGKALKLSEIQNARRA